MLPWRHARRRLGAAETERKAVESGHLAREADVTERIGAVGRHVDLEDGVAGGGHRFQQGRARLGASSRRAPGCRRPACPRWQSPISASEQSIPSLVTPAISRAPMVMPAAGRCVPSGASATRPPGSGTLGAPQIDALLVPLAAIDGHQAKSRSAGVRLDLAHRRHHQRLEPRAVRVRPSTSSPARVSRSAIS